ncbi:unnamed protein product [Cuscuta epithymum]|uniref:Uncharacterized protein n=1 Tax=Cuscuta epithymum TaxID=186058 RepID=A0AAV0F9P5_9ASTE|nr:unnamed protein product [Cuscuta epithymum]
MDHLRNDDDGFPPPAAVAELSPLKFWLAYLVRRSQKRVWCMDFS